MKSKFIIYIVITFGLFACKMDPDKFLYYDDFVSGLNVSRKLNKPVLLAFTGKGCFGNDPMDNLLNSSRIQSILNEEFITIKLHMDDNREIRKEDTLNLHKLGISKLDKLKTVGELNARIQIDMFEIFVQPYFVIIDSDRRLLIEPFMYPNHKYHYQSRNNFISKLKKGLAEYKIQK